MSRLRIIEASPASYESISLVMAAGLDLFFVRAAPSAQFDLLASDFNYPLLVLIMVGLTAATLFAGSVSNAKTLRTNWA